MTADRIPALLEPIQNLIHHQESVVKLAGPDAYDTQPLEAMTRLLAAVQAVTAIHKPVTLWMTHEDADISYQSKEDVLAERTDLTEGDLVPFELCGHCKMIEDSPCEGECTMQAGYRESLWPCPTVAAVAAALGGEA